MKALALVAILATPAIADGFIAVPQLGVSVAHFSQPPDDEGPQLIVGPTIAIFLGARVHGVVAGVALEHTEGLVHAEEGYATDGLRVRVERVQAQLGFAFHSGRYTVLPMLAAGLFDSDVPFFGGDLVGVSAKAALAIDFALSPTMAFGVSGAFDLGIAPTNDRTATSLGATLAARLTFSP